jgi:ABC-type nitrate/sulfonate/bicarbonate transport system substrate-binding protein
MPVPVKFVALVLCTAATVFGALGDAGAPARAAEAAKIRVNTFPNAKALPVHVGLAKGLFAK